MEAGRTALQIPYEGDFTHSSSNSFIRYGTNIVHQVPHLHDQVKAAAKVVPFLVAGYYVEAFHH